MPTEIMDAAARRRSAEDQRRNDNSFDPSSAESIPATAQRLRAHAPPYAGTHAHTRAHAHARTHTLTRPNGRTDALPAPAARPGGSGGGRLSEDEIEHVWWLYKQTGSSLCHEALVVHYMRKHVRKIAERLHAGLPQHVDIEDLVQQGYLGLVESIERFETDRDVKFETFSSRRIFGAMRDYLRAIDPVPRLIRQRSKQLQREEERFVKQHGRLPDLDELRGRVEVCDAEFERMLDAGQPAAMVSFNAAAGASGPAAGFDPEDDADAMDSFEDETLGTPLSMLEHEDLRRWITEGFSRRDRLIIILYYYEHMTMKEIGHTLGCSESRVSQRLDSILQQLRGRLAGLGAEVEFYAK